LSYLIRYLSSCCRRNKSRQIQAIHEQSKNLRALSSLHLTQQSFFEQSRCGFKIIWSLSQTSQWFWWEWDKLWLYGTRLLNVGCATNTANFVVLNGICVSRTKQCRIIICTINLVITFKLRYSPTLFKIKHFR